MLVLYAPPGAELLFGKAAQLEANERGECFARGKRGATQKLVAAKGFLKEVPDFLLRVGEVAWRCRSLCRVAGRDAECFEDMKWFGDKRGPEADEEMAAERVRITDPVGDSEQVAVVFTSEPCGDERTGLRPRFYHEDSVRDTDHEPVPLGEVVHARGRVGRIFGEESAAALDDLLCEGAVAARIEIRSEPRAGDRKRVEARLKCSLVSAGIYAEREPAHDRDRVAGEPEDERTAGLFAVAGHCPTPHDREIGGTRRRERSLDPELPGRLGDLEELRRPLLPHEFSDSHIFSILGRMLDIHFIRDNADLIKAGATKKHIVLDLDRLIAVDDERKRLRQEIDAKKAEQNRRSNEIQIAKDDDKSRLIEQMQHLKAGMGETEERLKAIMAEWQALMLTVPNIPDMSVPDGDSDAQNLEVRTWGAKPEMAFMPKSHYELMTSLGMADFERGAKVAGFRGYFLKGDGARLLFALRRYVEDRFMNREGFVPLVAPSLVRREAFVGTGYLPQSEEDLYKTQDSEYLAGTAEVATMAYFMNETVDKASLPLKFFAYSPCFRREAGSHGKDEKGVFRVHEFEKYEQVVLSVADHAESVRLHEELTANAEALLQELGLHYHVVVNCGGDLGLGQVKKYDLEAWMPSENQYRETHSASYFHDFQTRRLNIRYRDGDGTLKYVHSLNNTALAMPRILTHIVENYQEADGSVRVPAVLVPYVGKDRIGPAH